MRNEMAGSRRRLHTHEERSERSVHPHSGPQARARAERQAYRLGRLAVIAIAALALGGCAIAMLNGAASSGGSSAGSSGGQGARSPSQKGTDEAISTAVRSKLAAHPALKGLNLGVDTHEGIVTLRGQVAKVEQRNAAQLAARSVQGVRAVQNLLTVH